MQFEKDEYAFAKQYRKNVDNMLERLLKQGDLISPERNSPRDII